MILLIWNEIPEGVKVFIVPNDHEMADHIRGAVNTYINSDTENEHSFAVNEWIESEACNQYRCNELRIIKCPLPGIDEVVIAGFFL